MIVTIENFIAIFACHKLQYKSDFCVGSTSISLI